MITKVIKIKEYEKIQITVLITAGEILRRGVGNSRSTTTTTIGMQDVMIHLVSLPLLDNEQMKLLLDFMSSWRREKHLSWLKNKKRKGLKPPTILTPVTTTTYLTSPLPLTQHRIMYSAWANQSSRDGNEQATRATADLVFSCLPPPI